MPGSRVVAVGHHQPRRVLTNTELATMVDTNDEWIVSRVGIEERRIVDGENVADLAVPAARMALESSGVDVADVDLVVVATCTNVDRSPNTAALVARALAIPSPAVLDVNVVCSGFCHALAVADQAIRCGSARTAIVVGVDIFTSAVDWSDRSTCILVGDGAGAVVITASEDEQISPVVWGSVPEMGDAVVIGGTPLVFTQQGQSVFRWTTSQLPRLGRQIIERAGLTPDDIDAVVLHQANLRIIEPMAKKIAPRAVVAKDVVVSGNTSAASVPLALSKLVRSGDVAPGAKILLFGFGGGLAYAGQVITCP